jgi:ParB-like chromosome segregation protein Spo0J
MRIDPEFESLIPPLSDEEFKQLEKNCCDYGIRDSLVIGVFPGSDEAVLIDGHNRYKIAQKCNLSFTEKRIDFESREKAIEWIILNQFGRRNLSKYDRSLLALKYKAIIQEQAQKRMSEGAKGTQISAEAKGETRDKLAKIADVSHDTIHKVEVIHNSGDKELEQQVRSGEKTIHRAYSEIKARDTPMPESRAQREARELREAKKRHEEFEQAKAEKVVSLADAVQDKEDMAEIADDFYEDFIRIGSKMLLVNNMIRDGSLKDILKAMDLRELSDLLNRARDYMGIMVRLQRAISEVGDEK